MCYCLAQSEAVSLLLLHFLQKSKINQTYWEEIKSEMINRKISGIITEAMEDFMPRGPLWFCHQTAQTMQLWMAELGLLWRLQFICPLVMLSSSDPELFFLSTTWVFFLLNVFPPIWLWQYLKDKGLKIQCYRKRHSLQTISQPGGIRDEAAGL